MGPSQGSRQPASMAARTSRFGRAVLIPTQIGWPSAPGTSACSQVQANLRVGEGSCRSRTLPPGHSTPVIGPVLGQWAITVSPPANSTSARNRL